jgi:hypothetical protein
MRTLLLAAACVVLFATAIVLRPDDGLAINCAAVRSACVSACNNRETSQAGFQEPLLDSILPGYGDRMPRRRPNRLQQRFPVL